MNRMVNYKPLRAALFAYDVLRLAALACFFAFFSPLEGAVRGGVFPHLVYLTPNALFPLMALFIFIGSGNFENYLPLYLAGKLIAVITFYFWAFLSIGPVLSEPYFGLEPGNFYQGFILLSGGFVLSVGDLLSIFGSSFLLRKIQPLRLGG